MLLAFTRSTSTKSCGTRVVNVVNTCASPGVWLPSTIMLKRRAGERIQTEVRAILNHHLETGGAAQAAHRRRRQDQNARVAQLGVARVELAHDRLRGLVRVFAMLKCFQRNEHRAGIGKIRADQQIEAGKLHRAVHAGNGAGDFTGAADDLLAALQARAIGQLREDDEIAGILRAE